jgi:hypothetical protein
VAADQPQGGKAAFESKYHPGIPADAEFEVILPYSPDTEATVPMRLAEGVRQPTQCHIELIQLLTGERACLAFEARGNLNP